jgi:hypothetical protein
LIAGVLLVLVGAVWIAKKSGFTLGELFGGRKGKGSKVAPKYRNPKDANQTWTGGDADQTGWSKLACDMKRFLIAS